MTIGWRFPRLDGGIIKGANDSGLETFKADSLGNFAREICQNSLDAKIKGAEGPVKVVFKRASISVKDYPNVFEKYRECIRACKEYWGESDKKVSEFVSKVQKFLDKEQKIPILIASDYNTTGLSGSKKGKETVFRLSAWDALTNCDGASLKNDNQTSGGSYGIGKNAPFVCSLFRMVFYNTFVSETERAFIGVTKLVTFLMENQETQPIGKYLKFSNDRENSGKCQIDPIFSEDADDFRDFFKRKERGTDVIVVGFNQDDGWKDLMIKAVLKNFFPAIDENQLVVEFGDEGDEKGITINKESLNEIDRLLKNEKESFASVDEENTYRLYCAYKTPDRKEKLEIIKPDDVVCYVRKDDPTKLMGKTSPRSFFRNGMLIESVSKQSYQSYSLVCIVSGEHLNKLLRTAEPPCHNKWEWNRIEDADKQNEAKEAIKRIRDGINRIIKEFFASDPSEKCDAYGVGAFLPSESSAASESSVSNNTLSPQITLGNVTARKIRKPDLRVEQGDVAGVENNAAFGTGKQHKRKRRKIDREDGVCIIEHPEENLRARAYRKLNGEYKVILTPLRELKNLYIKCFAETETGNKESKELEMSFFKSLDNDTDYSHVTVAGPLNLSPNKSYTFLTQFKRNETMELKLSFEEHNNG